ASSTGENDFATISGYNNGNINNGNIPKFNVVVENSLGEIVWRSAETGITAGNTGTFYWDGTFNTSIGNGFVPDGEYLIVAYDGTKRSDNPPSITKTIVVDNSLPSIIVPENI